VEFINQLLVEIGVNSDASRYLSVILMILFIALICVLANLITKKIILRLITHIIRKNKVEWDNAFLDRKVFHKLSHIVPAVIIYYNAPSFPAYQSLIEKGAFAYIFIVGVLAFSSFLDACNDIYLTFDVSKEKPIKGYIQVVKIAAFVVGGIVLIAELIGQNPIILLSGLGALSAVLMLIFKDSILGLVAGIQLSANEMVRVGDWIEMPKYHADGDVIDITLNTIKVKNWDKTVTMIPSYALISDSFKNWRGMQETGGRRIKRSLYIDMTSICFCTPEMLAEFKHIHFLEEYIGAKEVEIEAWNQENRINPASKVNGRKLTNIGVYQVYIQNYLHRHPQIHQGLTMMVRQLAPGEHGLPLEIYAFTNDIRWAVYEAAQADIFDHLLAIAQEFGLRVFQNPSGHDFSRLGSTSFAPSRQG
jgi:miniconductance mechanosensitive channel